MKPFVILAATVLGALARAASGAFVPAAGGFAAAACGRHHRSGAAPAAAATPRRAAAVPLEPEPEGGEELAAAVSTLPGCRMKRMAAVTNVTSAHGAVHEYWMTAVAEGAMVQEIRTKVLKDASKKANFPGFRKGQVPQYAMPQITGFAVQESIIKTVQAAVDAYGLKALDGEDGSVTVKEDVVAMAEAYKQGDSLPFTATLKAAMPPSSAASTEAKNAEAEEAVEAS